MNNTYSNINIKCPSDQKEILMAELAEFPILGIIENEFDIEVSFYKNDWEDHLKNDITSLLSNYDQCELVHEQLIEERNWNEEWEKEVPAIHINKNVGIAPKWKMKELTEKYKIEINPKMSFGTGSHATTRLVCNLMSDLTLNGKTVIDAGTGTGVLAIYSAMLGASKILAFDNNEWSVQNAKENFEINSVNEVIDLKLLELDSFTSIDKCDLLLANILAPVILRNMEKFVDSIKESNGIMILSGILSEEKEDIISKAKSLNCELTKYQEEDEWAGFVFKVKN